MVTPRAGLPPVDARTAIILCGGRSKRFGADKALAVHDGVTFLDRTIAVARAVASEVILATGSERRYAESGLPVVLDAVPDGGPLAGIAAGLERATTGFFVVIAVDLPFVTEAAVAELFAALADSEYVLPRTDRGLEPLFSAGRTEPCRAAARRLLASGEAAAHRLAEGVVTAFLDVTPAGHPAVRAALRNVNRPGDLDRGM